MQLIKRNLIRGDELSLAGETFTVVALRESTGGFYKYDLLLKDAKGKQKALGLQAQSINMDGLIEELGENSDKWPNKKIRLAGKSWNDRVVVRVVPPEE